MGIVDGRLEDVLLLVVQQVAVARPDVLRIVLGNFQPSPVLVNSNPPETVNFFHLLHSPRLKSQVLPKQVFKNGLVPTQDTRLKFLQAIGNNDAPVIEVDTFLPDDARYDGR